MCECAVLERCRFGNNLARSSDMNVSTCKMVFMKHLSHVTLWRSLHDASSHAAPVLFQGNCTHSPTFQCKGEPIQIKHFIHTKHYRFPTNPISLSTSYPKSKYPLSNACTLTYPSSPPLAYPLPSGSTATVFKGPKCPFTRPISSSKTLW